MVKAFNFLVVSLALIGVTALAFGKPPECRWNKTDINCAIYYSKFCNGCKLDVAFPDCSENAKMYQGHAIHTVTLVADGQGGYKTIASASSVICSMDWTCDNFTTTLHKCNGAVGPGLVPECNTYDPNRVCHSCGVADELPQTAEVYQVVPLESCEES